MGKITSEGNSIHSLDDQNGVLQSNTEKVLGITAEYYSNLFQAGETNKRLQKEILSKTKVKINQDQKAFCDKELDLNELEDGMKHLCLSRFQLGTSPPGNPRENFFERANPGHPGKIFCLIPCPGAKNDGRIPGCRATFSQTRRNCSLSLQKNP